MVDFLSYKEEAECSSRSPRTIISNEGQVSKDDKMSEWVNMPEFVQPKLRPHAAIMVRFENEEDLQDFARRIDQELNKKTKSIWHPKLIRGKDAHLRWGDES